MTDSAVNHLRTVVRQLLANEQQPTPLRIREVISQIRAVPGFQISDEVAEKIACDMETFLDISMSIGHVVQEDFEEWLSAAKKDIQPYYWDRYKQLLEQKGFPKQVQAKMDEVTDRILGLLENPKKGGPWDRRGMVVGHVQSGKTANYTGLICKAADAGYRLIIVIAGIHNNLRNQTQHRIDEGFVGRDSARLLSGKGDRFIGVGKFDNRYLPLTLTNTSKDFNKQTAGTVGVQLRALNVPAVMVIKKNANTLRNVVAWLREHNAQGGSNIVDAPMLLIDDEADNASIDISKDPQETSRINGLIRQLLELFHRRCYLGYTATPFANIFIDPESEKEMLGADLFPRDFIMSLDAPDNYFGSHRIFGDSADLSVTREITDNEDLLPLTHPIDHEIADLPPSLITAVRTFILVRTIRLLRGQIGQHNSMLVNASRFTRVQSQLRNEIHSLLTRIERRVRYEAAKPVAQALQDEEIKWLHDIWEAEFSDAGFTWSQVQGKLLEAIAPVQVVEVNSKSSGALRYDEHAAEGLNVIAVGGFSLSRGLTLEGLTVSYFLRNSMMYDTLMQMGRWFGYRPGYEDLCRVWMRPEAIGWYEHISDSIEELREELREMERSGLTPKDFGLKVRSHPDSLIVTARNKMRTTQLVPVQIGLANAFIETAILSSDLEKIDANRKAGRALVTRLMAEAHLKEAPDGNFFWSGVPAGAIVDFIGAFQNHPRSLHTNPQPVQKYISQRAGDELAVWDVVLISRRAGKPETIPDPYLGPEVRCQYRTIGRQSRADYMYITDKQRVASRGVERIGVDESDCKAAEAEYRIEKRKGPDEPINFPDRIYRSRRKRPLLILHLLELHRPGKDDEGGPRIFNFGVVAWSISFPKSEYENNTVAYVVNTTWWKENFGSDYDEDEDGDESDE